MKFIRLISFADILTLGNGICGVLAIIFIYRLQPDITIPSGLLIFALIFDGLDGLAARKFGTKHDYGKYLDSFADSISFGLAPAYMLYIIFSGPGSGSKVAELQLLIVSITAIITGGFAVFRLIRFSIEDQKDKHFSGLATPAFAFLIIITSHLLDPHRSENDLITIPFFACALFILGNVLLVSKVKYPKVRDKIAIRLAAVFIAALISLLLMRLVAVDSQTIFIYYRILSYSALIVIAGYVIGGPIYLQLFDPRRS